MAAVSYSKEREVIQRQELSRSAEQLTRLPKRIVQYVGEVRLKFALTKGILSFDLGTSDPSHNRIFAPPATRVVRKLDDLDTAINTLFLRSRLEKKGNNLSFRSHSSSLFPFHSVNFEQQASPLSCFEKVVISFSNIEPRSYALDEILFRIGGGMEYALEYQFLFLYYKHGLRIPPNIAHAAMIHSSAELRSKGIHKIVVGSGELRERGGSIHSDRLYSFLYNSLYLIHLHNLHSVEEPLKRVALPTWRKSCKLYSIDRTLFLDFLLLAAGNFFSDHPETAIESICVDGNPNKEVSDKWLGSTSKRDKEILPVTSTTYSMNLRQRMSRCWHIICFNWALFNGVRSFDLGTSDPARNRIFTSPAARILRPFENLSVAIHTLFQTAELKREEEGASFAFRLKKFSSFPHHSVKFEKQVSILGPLEEVIISFSNIVSEYHYMLDGGLFRGGGGIEYALEYQFLSLYYKYGLRIPPNIAHAAMIHSSAELRSKGIHKIVVGSGELRERGGSIHSDRLYSFLYNSLYLIHLHNLHSVEEPLKRVALPTWRESCQLYSIDRTLFLDLLLLAAGNFFSDHPETAIESICVDGNPKEEVSDKWQESASSMSEGNITLT